MQKTKVGGDMKKRLTIKQKKFADYYIKTGNAALAAENAGYSKNTARFIGSENLTKPNIKSYIKKKMQEIEDEQIDKAEEVLKHLTSMMRGEVDEEVVVTENIGDFQSDARIINKQVSARERIRAALDMQKQKKQEFDKKNKVPYLLYKIALE